MHYHIIGLSIKVYAQNRPQRITFQVLGIIHKEIKYKILVSN